MHQSFTGSTGKGYRAINLHICTNRNPYCFILPCKVPEWTVSFIHLFNHSFIHSRIYKAPLQEIYSEAPSAQPRRYRSVLSNLKNALSLFLGRRWISKGSPFQVEGPTMENARR